MSFNIGLSGLRAATKDLNVTGNNIANAGTVGFKQSRAEFADVYAATVLGTGKNQQGSGVLLASISQQFNQGNVNYTQNPLDLAINGNGFFQVSNNGALSYTRAGFFGTDKEGFIVDNFGYNLQGYTVDTNDQVMEGVVGNLQIRSASQEPRATSEMKQSFNLNSTNNAPTNANFSPTDPASYNSSTSTNIYDSQGNAHTFTQYFVKTGPNNWQMNVMIDGGHPQAGAANFAAQSYIGSGPQAVLDAAVAALPADSFSTNMEAEVQDLIDNHGATEEQVVAAIARIGNSSPITLNMAFDSAGKPLPVAGDAEGYFSANPDGTLTMNPGMWTPSLMNDAKPPIAISNGSTMNPTGMQLDMRTATQYASSFAVTAVAQNGYTTGELSGIEIDDTGLIFARYTNGQSKVQGQVILADFANVQGLKPVGKTQWVQSLESGEPVRNPGRTGTLGAIQAGALEDSNVELSDQLVNLIVAQRNYQANAKTIETESAITQTIINLR
ncbi:MAG: flagellar hook protein FlgE [Thiopseudomonas sp.]|nr:flagellar hook protein FlgE [Thiopseudomonas sp.]